MNRIVIANVLYAVGSGLGERVIAETRPNELVLAQQVQFQQHGGDTCRTVVIAERTGEVIGIDAIEGNRPVGRTIGLYLLGTEQHITGADSQIPPTLIVVGEIEADEEVHESCMTAAIIHRVPEARGLTLRSPQRFQTIDEVDENLPVDIVSGVLRQLVVEPSGSCRTMAQAEVEDRPVAFLLDSAVVIDAVGDRRALFLRLSLPSAT